MIIEKDFVMKKEKKKHRFGLSLLYSFVVFCILLLTIMVAGVVVYVLSYFDILEEGENYLKDVRHIIVYMSLLSMFVGWVIAILTSRVPLIPLNRIATQLQRLAKGDFKARLFFGAPLGKHPTMIEISESFNLMAEELENTELLRSDFVNNFSHEFKTPIVSIAGFAKLLKKDNLTEEQRREYLDIIEEESLRLSYMAMNVLHLTKIENQAILTDISSFNLSEQIRMSVLLLENRWVKKQIEFSLEFDEVIIQANEELLKQVWINLIDNAIKFSIESGVIEIRIVEKKNCYAVSVINEGIEIPIESRKKIFNKFYQCDESHATEGNGVGLAIVSRVIKLHKGTIWVESKGGKTTFIVEIPKKTV